MFCRNCGKQINDDSLFCVYCGTAVRKIPVQTDYFHTPPSNLSSGQMPYSENGNAETNPDQSTPAQSAPTQSTPNRSAAVQSTPAQSAPFQSTPVWSVPTDLTASGNQEIRNQAAGNPEIGNPGVSNPEIANPGVSNPGLVNPGIGNPGTGNPEFNSPRFENTNFKSQELEIPAFELQSSIMRNGQSPEKMTGKAAETKARKKPAKKTGSKPGNESGSESGSEPNKPGIKPGAKPGTKPGKKSGKGKHTGLIIGAIAACFAVLLLAGGIFAFFHFFKNDSSEEETVYNRAEHVEILLAESDYITGQEATAEFTVIVGDNAEGDITVTDENGTVITTLTNDGSGSLEGSFTIKEDSDRIGTLTATSENGISGTANFFVHPEVTEEMIDTLLAVGSDLAEYSEEQGYTEDDELSKKEIKALVKWLEADERVADVVSDDSSIMYQTVDNLIGAYFIDVEEEGYMSSSSSSSSSKSSSSESESNPDTSNNTSTTSTTGGARKVKLDTTFDKFMKGESLSSNTIIESGLPSTNSRIIHLAGDSEDSVIGKLSPLLIEEENELVSNSIFDELETPHYNEDARDLLLNGDYTDCGLLVINMHGVVGPSLTGMNIGPIDEKMEKYNYLWGSTSNSNTRRMFTVTDEDGTNIYLTAYGLDCALGKKKFDNTVVFLAVCESSRQTSVGESFPTAFVKHGAAYVIGGERKLLATLIYNTMDQLVDLWSGTESDPLILNDAFSQIHFLDTSDAEKKVGLSWLIDYWAHQNDSDQSLSMSRLPNSDGYKRMVAGTTQISGYVYDSAGNPIPGAKVTAYRWLNHKFEEYKTAETDSEGKYVFEEMEYTLYGICAEATPETGFTELKSRGWTSLKIEEVKEEQTSDPITINWYTLSGRVIDSKTSDPISNAAVSLKASADDFEYVEEGTSTKINITTKESEITVQTSSDGTFQLEGVPECMLEYYASATGYASSTPVSIEIKADQDLGDIELKKQENYWDYIHDTLLPDLGYSGLTPVWTWDDPENKTTDNYDILAAEVLDMNADGTDDMLLYLVKDAELYVDLYTRIDGQITLLGETTMNANYSVYSSYLWLGTMEIGGETFLVEQYEIDFGSQAHNINFYRYGNEGLEKVADYGWYPGAGPRNNETHTTLTDFLGMTENKENEVIYVGDCYAVARYINNYLSSESERLGLPSMTTVSYEALEETYGQKSVSTFWGTDALHKTLMLHHENIYVGQYSNGWTKTDDHYTVSEYTPYLEEMAKRDK